MRRSLVALLVTTFVGFGYVLAQNEPPAPPMHRPHLDRGDIFAKLKLTDDQKEQMKNIKFETEKKEIELRSKLALSKLELGRLVMSETPDKAAIEKRINEVAVNESALKINKLNGWFEANKNLTPEQQKVWREFLRTEVMKATAPERKENMRRELRP